MSDSGAAEVAGARDVAGVALLDLVAIMDRLRTECPWDARQTHESLAPYLLEETYEALEALERRDMTELRGELGDVLLQVLFHARVAAERTDGTGFTIDDVANGIAAKLIRRHPHVFADVTVTGAEDVKRNWDQIKADERAAAAGGDRTSALDGVPMGQPALSLAAQLQRRAQRAGAPAELADLAGVACPAEPAGRGAGPPETGGSGAGGSEAGGSEAGGSEAGGFGPARPGSADSGPGHLAPGDRTIRALMRSARSERNCSRWSPGPPWPAWTPSSNFAAPRGFSAAGSAPGKTTQSPDRPSRYCPDD